MNTSSLLSAAPRPGLASTEKVLLLLFIAVLCLLPRPALSQTDIPVEQLLFEPVPMPDPDAPIDPSTLRGRLVGEGLLERLAVSLEDQPEPQVDEAGQLALIREIEAYLESMEENEAEKGPFSNELKENLLSLGQLYQQRGDHRAAVQHLLRAQNIIRVNDGLNSMAQIPVIDAVVPSLLELEDYQQADELKDQVVEIHKAAYGEADVRIVPALKEVGEWNVQAFLDRSNILTNINRIDAQRFVMDPNNYTQPIDDPRTSPLFKLYQAQGNFLTAIDLIIKAKDYTHPLLQDLERKLVTTYFLRMHRENILYEPDFYLTRKKRKTGSRLNQNAIELMNSEDYEMGQASLKRSIAYLVNDGSAPPLALANAMLADADWDLLFSRKVKAAEKYQEAYNFFTSAPRIQEAVASVAYPEIPQVLPIYLPPPNSREKLGIPEDEIVNYLGYFDVTFSLDKFGKAKRIRIRDSAGEVTRNMEIRLNQYLRNVQFRPRFKDGEPDTDTLALRYYVGY